MQTLPAFPHPFGLFVRAFAAAVLVLLALPAAAQGTGADAPATIDSALEQQIRQLAAEGTRAAGPGAPRFEVSVGQLDPRLRLAPCALVEPYLPEGMRLWGKARIGLRCTQGTTRWNVYLPITVKAFGPGLVVTGNISGGSVLSEADLTPAEVDLAETNAAAVTEMRLAVGRTLTQTLKPGQSLRQSHLRPRQWFAAGDTVTVLAQGPGFSVSGEGQALNNGVEGLPVRVRTESGRVLTGQAVGDRRVELAL
ncbi:MAG: flagellar basal body P-ring formation chaperone FlgA [Burkholderiaceae bacterium]